MARSGTAGAGTDTVVIGAGVIGLGIAWRCRQRGLSVTVVDPAPGSGASRTAAGMLAPVTELHYGEQPLLALNLASAVRCHRADELPLRLHSAALWADRQTVPTTRPIRFARRELCWELQSRP